MVRFIVYVFGLLLGCLALAAGIVMLVAWPIFATVAGICWLGMYRSGSR